ncbi:MAG: hypothetical protein ACRD16_04985, partial [Thermoanaerobaculia bacterium]
SNEPPGSHDSVAAPLTIAFPNSETQRNSMFVNSGHDMIIPPHQVYLRWPTALHAKVGPYCKGETGPVNGNQSFTYLTFRYPTITMTPDGSTAPPPAGKGLVDIQPAKTNLANVVHMKTDPGADYSNPAHPPKASWAFGSAWLGDVYEGPTCWGFAEVQSQNIVKPPRHLAQSVSFAKVIPENIPISIHGTDERGTCTLEFPPNTDVDLEVGNASAGDYENEVPRYYVQRWDSHFELYYLLSQMPTGDNAVLPYWGYCDSAKRGTQGTERAKFYSSESEVRERILFVRGGLNCPPALFAPAGP